MFLFFGDKLNSDKKGTSSCDHLYMQQWNLWDVLSRCSICFYNCSVFLLYLAFYHSLYLFLSTMCKLALDIISVMSPLPVFEFFCLLVCAHCTAFVMHTGKQVECVGDLKIVMSNIGLHILREVARLTFGYRSWTAVSQAKRGGVFACCVCCKSRVL